jgi:predicted nucleotidyltransferase
MLLRCDGIMPTALSEALRILREHEPELRRRGVTHAAVFGSVARGEAAGTSDVDILIDLDPDKPIGVFDYAAIKLYIAELFGIETLDGPIDIVSRNHLKPQLRVGILRDAIHAF